MVSMSTFKVRLDEGMSDVSNDAISAVYPEYYSEVYPEMTALQMRIAGFRAKKDVHKSTLDDLDGYCASVERSAELTTPVLRRASSSVQSVPAMAFHETLAIGTISRLGLAEGPAISAQPLPV
jgi:hypothetical protein